MQMRAGRVAPLLGSSLLLLAVPPGALARPTIARVSVASAGVQGNAATGSEFDRNTALSVDGRFVAFGSDATNLVPGDTNGVHDVLVHDRQTGQTTRVSVVSFSGTQANGQSRAPSISADGRFVAFDSAASNLVLGDTNGSLDIFVHDRQTGQTTRVSVSSIGEQGNGNSGWPTITPDGRFVGFGSTATNLVAGDTNGFKDVFVHDRQTGVTSRMSVSSSGAQGNALSGGEGDFYRNAALSDDGRFVAFSSRASNLVTGDTGGFLDTFVHDRQSGQTTRASVSSSGEQGGSDSYEPSISADGRFVAFASFASNLVPEDTNGNYDAFVHDRQTGQTTRVSVASLSGNQGNDVSSVDFPPSISADGRFVAFLSRASNLVPGDTNGRYDVFVHDRQTRQTTRVSVDVAGTEGNQDSQWPSISADGHVVAFSSLASNLIAGDTNDVRDAFAAVLDAPLACPGDANGDLIVNFTDLNIVLSDFGLSGPALPGDLNADGVVDFLDLNIVLSNFGTAC